jgi:glycogen operon protein
MAGLNPPPDALQAGRAWPLGAHWDGNGVNFALVAPHADAVFLCLFEHSPPHAHEIARLPLPCFEHGVWHGYLPAAAPGLVYGYRLSGPYAPALGQRYNSAKLMLDPYAREVLGHYAGEEVFFDYQTHGADNAMQNDAPHAAHLPCPHDNAAHALKARVIDPGYDWQGDCAPRIKAGDTVLYECHVKGLTQCWPNLPDDLRGTYAALTRPEVLDYLQNLGITSLSLLPIQFHADEARLCRLGLVNYWGYNTIGFFAPQTRYWSGRPGTSALSEFKDAVRALHARGIEVILDVVYNHSAEGDETGPSLSLRGIDNELYYHAQPQHPGLYQNWTGCGNSLNLSQPRVLQMVLDSLRYWVGECHVDGFRFDLAPVLGRDAHGFSRDAAFFAALLQDPLLSQVKLIAEPWDVGPNGYQLGQFPTGWLEWNDQYRDTMRAFWLHQWPSLGEFARRFAASSDLFQQRQRLPTASVNFISAHDGFTLADLVAYNHKHNQANGEHNRDGHNHNHSWNCGVEGPSNAPDIGHLRSQLQRALLATLIFSQGTPMLLAGDEIGHSQAGNNNAYCQDNPTAWLNWGQANSSLQAWVKRLLGLRKRYRMLRLGNWFRDAASGCADIEWLTALGEPMQPSDWDSKKSYCISIVLRDDSATAEDCLILCNAEAQTIDFTLPPGKWCMLLNSHHPDAEQSIMKSKVQLEARSVLFSIISN